ncbi:MAG: hypothetical protein GAK35_03051 [Herbaspirillum frisingense]|uniref:Uncharacterized protein n=1 Tax=Herbaspirillum frisingense TaxID=92645 RepID=A0A7V8FUZ7_9BURK|nr:MAG: hypothetical protein GAK35_03051 [Herbaspirillum frisingense]
MAYSFTLETHFMEVQKDPSAKLEKSPRLKRIQVIALT